MRTMILTMCLTFAAPAAAHDYGFHRHEDTRACYQTRATTENRRASCVEGLIRAGFEYGRASSICADRHPFPATCGTDLWSRDSDHDQRR